MATRQPAARPSADDTYSALLSRYRPAYVAATNIAQGGAVFAIAGVVAAIWGAQQFNAGGLSRSLAPLLVGGGFFSMVVGLSLSMLASILRAVLDRTAFTAPGLDDAERVRLAFEAAGQSAPRGRAPSPDDG